VGCGHMSLLTKVNAWHSKPFRDIRRVHLYIISAVLESRRTACAAAEAPPPALAPPTEFLSLRATVRTFESVESSVSAPALPCE
jgi:hypothetical protein